MILIGQPARGHTLRSVEILHTTYSDDLDEMNADRIGGGCAVAIDQIDRMPGEDQLVLVPHTDERPQVCRVLRAR